MIIYLVRNLATGMAYVGQTVGALKARWACHLSTSKNVNTKKLCMYLHRAMRKHGLENFHVSVLEQCHTIDELNAREAWWIVNLNTPVPNGYNIRPGGSNAPMHPETRRKISEIKKGKPGTKWTDEHKAAHSANMKGRKRTPSQCEAIAARLKANHPCRGKPISDEHKRKLSLAGKGRKQRPEWIARRIAASVKTRLANGGWPAGAANPNFGKTHSAETRVKISANWRQPVLTPELRERFSANGKKNLGRKHSAAARRNMSLAKVGRNQSPEAVAKRMAGMKRAREERTADAARP